MSVNSEHSIRKVFAYWDINTLYCAVVPQWQWEKEAIFVLYCTPQGPFWSLHWGYSDCHWEQYFTLTFAYLVTIHLWHLWCWNVLAADDACVMLNTFTVATGSKSRTFSTVPSGMTRKPDATCMRTARRLDLNKPCIIVYVNDFSKIFKHGELPPLITC